MLKKGSSALKKSWMYRNINKLGTIFVTGTFIFIVDYLKIPNPAVVCLIGVVFATFVAGYFYGFISGILTLLYCAYFFSDNHSWFNFSEENAEKILVILVAVISMVSMVGWLKHMVEMRTKELLKANEKLTEISLIDELTGLYNYRHFRNTIETEWRRSIRNRSKIAIAMIDIDFFKSFNDCYGHHTGNECLQRVAEIIKTQLHRASDFVARYGGEEFVVILPDTDSQGAKEIMEKVRLAIADNQIENKPAKPYCFVTISIGVASVLPEREDSYETLLKHADLALYEAKRQGKNMVLEYDESMIRCSINQ